MTRDFDAIPGAEIRKDLAAGFLDFLLNKRDFLIDADAKGMCLRMLLELIQLDLEFDYRLLEIEMMFHSVLPR